MEKLSGIYLKVYIHHIFDDRFTVRVYDDSNCLGGQSGLLWNMAVRS